MTRRSKILAWGTILLIFLIAAYYFVLPKVFEKLVEPRNPKLEIDVTYDIGWWANQESLKIEAFEVKLVESELNLFNKQSLISYTVKGKLSNSDNWKPFVDKIHLSQRFLNKDYNELHPDSVTTEMPEAIIEITPIIEVVNDNDYNGEKIDFEFTNELKLESFHWGNNWVRFRCADKSKDLFLDQKK